MTLLLLVIISIFSMVFFHKSPEEVYLSHIKKSFRGVELDGPEKSAFRDGLMTRNPVTGKINHENIQNHYRQRVKSRLPGEDRDFKWEQVNTEIAGRVRSIMIDPNDGNKLWAGAVTGGLWYSPDFRNNSAWIPVSDDWESLSISTITFDPNDTQTLYVGTGESYTSVNIYRESSSAGVGIYKSEDGGATWSLMPSTEGFDYVNDIVIKDEGGISVIYVGVASGLYQGSVFGSQPTDGLYRSDDGGTTWEQVLPNISGESVPYAVSDIELTASGDLYVGTMRNLELKGGGIILHSTDGMNWNVEDRYVTTITGEDAGLIPGRVRITSESDIVYAVATSGFVNSFDQIRDIGFFTRLMYKESDIWYDFDGPSSSWASIPWHALAFDVDPNDSKRIAAGGLNAYALSNVNSAGGLSWVGVSNWASMYYFSDYLIGYYGLTNVDSIKNHFVHADIHTVLFVPGSSDELLTATDGGVQFTADFSKSFELPTGDKLDEYSTFSHINNSFASTQYYTIALHPEEGNNEVLAGSQDNSTHTSETGEITYSSMIGGGDGAYCFFDADDPELRITSSQSNNYNIWVGDTGNGYGFSSGTFINPAAYDDRSNLLYANMAVDGGFEALNTGIEGRFLDTLGVLNINSFLGKDMLELPQFSYIELGTSSTVAFSALKISPHDDELDATMVIANQLGDVFTISGLPYSPVAVKIDNDQLPVGYVSSVDIGDTNDNILVTFSNYGVESVWYTKDGGESWENLERNLPDVPVRHGVFNPHDDKKIIIATEVGVWGLENIFSQDSEWIEYNEGLPNVRVDMLNVRKSDSVIALATHGRGVFLGKFDQGGNAAPDALFTATELEEDPTTFEFDASMSGDADGDPITYAWNFGDQSSGNGIMVSHTYAKNGTYQVELSVSDGTDVSYQTISVEVTGVPLGLEEQFDAPYPNPTSGIVNIDSSIESVKIYSISGALLFKIDQPEGTVDLTGFEKGVYLMRMRDEVQKEHTFKIFKN